MERVLASRVLKTWLANSGYPMVAMGAKREGRAYIHRLVAEAFLDRPDGCDQVNHKSGDKSDNSAANLEWVTQSQNMVHAVHALGVRGGQFGPGRKRYAAGVRAA